MSDYFSSDYFSSDYFDASFDHVHAVATVTLSALAPAAVTVDNVLATVTLSAPSGSTVTTAGRGTIQVVWDVSR